MPTFLARAFRAVWGRFAPGLARETPRGETEDISIWVGFFGPGVGAGAKGTTYTCTPHTWGPRREG